MDKIDHAPRGDLEHLIDRYGLEEVVEAIRSICYEKSDRQPRTEPEPPEMRRIFRSLIARDNARR